MKKKDDNNLNANITHMFYKMNTYLKTSFHFMLSSASKEKMENMYYQKHSYG